MPPELRAKVSKTEVVTFDCREEANSSSNGVAAPAAMCVQMKRMGKLLER
jgi:hypothetical protein